MQHSTPENNCSLRSSKVCQYSPLASGNQQFEVMGNLILRQTIDHRFRLFSRPSRSSRTINRMWKQSLIQDHSSDSPDSLAIVHFMRDPGLASNHVLIGPKQGARNFHGNFHETFSARIVVKLPRSDSHSALGLFRKSPKTY